MMRFRFPLVAAVLAATATAWCQSVVTFIHTNDLHAHADATKVKGTPLGGYARQATVILKLRATETNPVLLNGGDTFQGTLYFNVYEGLADLQYLNLIGYQACAVGNHEFDRGPAVLGTYAKNARFPLLACNLDVSGEPSLRGLIKPSAIVMAGSEKIGVIGAITPDVTNISSPGPNVRVRDLTSSIRGEVSNFLQQGIKKIVLVSHLGYDVEQVVAKSVTGIDVIIGGHSHTLLGDPKVKDVTGEGPYPTVVTNADGHRTLIVSAWEWGKVVGRLRVEFDKNDEVSKWDGAPIPITQDIPENPTVVSLYQAFNKPISQLRSQPVGEAAVELIRDAGSTGESLMGDVLADAMLDATAKYGSVVAFANAGGVRSGVQAGRVTYGNLIEVAPFGNTLTVLELKGQELIDAISESPGGGSLYPSRGTSYTVGANGRISNLVVAGQPVDPGRTYIVTLNSFTAGGGDKHVVLQNAKGRRTDTGIIDLDALIDYFKAHTPVQATIEGRIRRQ